MMIRFGRLSSRKFSAAAALAVSMLLGACTAPVSEADVTRFHNFPAAPTARTLLVEPMRPEQHGLEFSRYADMVGQRLGAHGFRPATDGPPQVVAKLGYYVTTTSAIEASDSGGRIGIGVGGGGSHVGGGIGTSFGLGGGPRPVFLRKLELVLVSSDGTVLFEGRVASRGGSPDLGTVMPLLIDALFEDFPGVSGTTNRVRLDMTE